MPKKRAIVSYDKLSKDQLKELEAAFPDGYAGAYTQIKTATGEMQDAIMWETEETIYLVKLQRPPVSAMSIEDEDEDSDEDGDMIIPDSKHGDEELDDDSDIEDDSYDDEDVADEGEEED